MKGKIAWLPFLLILLIYVFLMSTICLAKYHTLSYHDFDLAVFCNVLYNTIKGNILYSSIRGKVFLGDHTALILLPVSFIYFLWQDPRSVLILQAIAFGCGLIPLFLIAKDEVEKSAGYVIAISYLLFPALWNANQFGFHPNSLAVFPLGFCLYCSLKAKWRWFAFFAFWALLCEENISLIITFMGILLFINKKSLKASISVFMVGFLWFLIAIFMVIPHFNFGEYGYVDYYRHFGSSMGEVIRNIFIHPVKTINYALRDECLFYLFQLFLPVLFLPLLSPKWLIPAVPIFAQNLLSSDTAQHSIKFQYNTPLLPLIFTATIFGMKNLHHLLEKRRKLFIGLYFLVIFFGIFCNAKWAKGPQITNELFHIKIGYLTHICWEKIREIPADTIGVASFEFLAPLSARQELYSLHNVAWGKRRFMKIPFNFKSEPEWVLVNFFDQFFLYNLKFPYLFKNIGNFLQKYDLKLSFLADNVAYFDRYGDINTNLVEIITSPPLYNQSINFGGIVELENVLIKEPKCPLGGFIPVELIFMAKKSSEIPVFILFDIRDNFYQQITLKKLVLGYLIYPTSLWKEGERVKVYFQLVLPPHIRPGEYFLSIGLQETSSLKMLPIIKDDMISGEFYKIGRIEVNLAQF